MSGTSHISGSSRSSHEERGLKLEVPSEGVCLTSRSSHEERGLKSGGRQCVGQ